MSINHRGRIADWSIVPGLDEVLEQLEAVGKTSLEQRGDTRERILETAIRLFSVRGYEACSIREIAEQVGIKAPGIYAHFASKKEILAASITRAFLRFLRIVLAQEDNTSAEARLGAVVRKHILFYLDQSAIATAFDVLVHNQAVKEILRGEVYTLITTAREMYISYLKSLVSLSVREREGLDLELTLNAILSICDGVGTWRGSWQSSSSSSSSPSEQIADYNWYLIQGLLRL